MDVNKEVFDESISDYSWLIRPCVLYEEEYKDCKSIKSRFHQQFVYGSFLDCTQWKRDYDNCMRWKEFNNVHACKELVGSELNRKEERLKAQNENDTWKKRKSPPSEWNKPLPTWMTEKMKTSFLVMKANDTNSADVNNKFCVLM